MQQRFIHICLSLLIVCLSVVTAEAQQSSFSYQGTANYFDTLCGAQSELGHG